MADDIVTNFADYAKELRSLAYHRGDHFLYGAAALIEAQQAEIEQLQNELTQLRSDNRRLADLHEGLYYATEEARRG